LKGYFLKENFSGFDFQVFLILFFSILFASYSLYSEEISKITFEQKGYEFPQEFLFFNIQSKPGTEFDRKILDDDIKRLYSTGRFADIAAESYEKDGKIEIIFKTLSKPRIKNIEFIGNKKYSSDKLKDKITIQQDSILNDKELSESLSSLRKFYEEKGYYSAVITQSTEPLEDNSVIVKINIQENLRKKVNSVSFKGNTIYSSWKLKNSIATCYSLWSWIFNTGLYSEDEIEKDKIRLRRLYWEKGYLDFTVKNVEVKEIPDDPELVDVTFELEEGKQYKVSKIKISGNTKFTEEELKAFLTIKEGDIFNIKAEEESVNAIKTNYYPLGYDDFICEVIRLPDYEKATVELDFQITEGTAYTVRNINISGNVNTKDHVIRRELVIQPGNPVNPDLIETSKNRLMGMNYFEKVEAVTVKVPDPSMKDVDITVEEKDTAKFAIGGGFSDTDSLVGTLELSQSNFDLFDPGNWFTGGGQRLRLAGQYGIERSDFSIDFTEPWLFGIPLSLNLSGFYHDREYDDWNQRSFGGDFSLTKRIFDDFTSIGLGYTIAGIKIYDMDNDLSEIFQKEKGTDTISKFSLNISRDTRDSLFDPKNGYLLSAMTELKYLVQV